MFLFDKLIKITNPIVNKCRNDMFKIFWRATFLQIYETKNFFHNLKLYHFSWIHAFKGRLYFCHSDQGLTHCFPLYPLICVFKVNST